MDQPMTIKEKKSPYGKYEEYEIKNAADTLMEAELIKKDADKMKYVQMCIDKKMSALKEISSIDELREVRKKKTEKDNDDSY